jgi:glycerol-3-phosphate acyltransferase PlsY
METTSMFITFGLPIGGYLLGSIPWGLVLTRIFSDVDIRKHGSGNIGATNVRRLAGTPLGVATLIGDVAKGVLPTYLAVILGPQAMMPVDLFVCASALAAFVGHLFPLYTGLQDGGKGVATAAGGIAVISPLSVVIALAVFLTVAVVSKRVSAGSLSAAAVLTPLVGGFTHSVIYATGALIMTLFIFYRHKSNIRRLLAGIEPSLRDRPK